MKNAIFAGFLLAAACASESAAPAIEPKLSALQTAVFAKSCANAACHGEGTGAAGMSLASADSSYANLVGKDSSEKDSAGTVYKRVEAGKPERSLLWLVVQHPVGKTAQMPKGIALESDKVDAIKAWIAAGALKN